VAQDDARFVRGSSRSCFHAIFFLCWAPPPAARAPPPRPGSTWTAAPPSSSASLLDIISAPHGPELAAACIAVSSRYPVSCFFIFFPVSCSSISLGGATTSTDAEGPRIRASVHLTRNCTSLARLQSSRLHADLPRRFTRTWTQLLLLSRRPRHQRLTTWSSTYAKPSSKTTQGLFVRFYKV
jgi:hypothetical protein